MHSSKKPIHPQAQQRTKRPCRSSRSQQPHFWQQGRGRLCSINSQLFQQGQKETRRQASGWYTGLHGGRSGLL